MLALQDYRAVVALLEERHFGRAARRLGVTQPALTARLRRIEDGLGARLFERGRAGVTPTAAGLAFAEGARRVLDAAAEAAGAAQSALQGFGETLRIGMTQVAAYQVVAASLAAFRRAQPRAQVRMIEGTTAGLEAKLEQREIDVAFLHPPLHASNLSERPLASARLLRIDADGGGRAGPLVRYPRAEAPVLMGRLGRAEDDGLPDGLWGAQGEADTILGAIVLSQAGYGACVVPADFPHAALHAANPAAQRNLGRLETSIAWRSLDRRPVVASLIEAAVAA